MSLSEEPFFFGDPHPLFGIVTRNEQMPQRHTGMLILSSGLVHRAGPFGLGVTLARAFASQGFPVLRFDQSARGDSDRRKNVSVSEAADLDIELAMAELRAQAGVEKVVLVGLCSGADDILRFASKADDVDGCILFDPVAERDSGYKLRYVLSKLAKPHRWPYYASQILFKGNGAQSVEDMYMGAIRELPTPEEARLACANVAAREGSILAVFSGGVSHYYNHCGQMSRSLGLASTGIRLEEHFLREAEHTYPLSFQRQELVEIVSEFSGRQFD